MKAKLRRPSPAMCVACIALFVSLGGTSVAAVSYARNAGKVDRKDAVASSSTLRRAAGNVVATDRRGPHKGKIPGKFLADVARTQSFGTTLEVNDNATSAPQLIAGIEGAGALTATCADQGPRPGVEDPITSVAWTNSSGATANVTRRRFNDELALTSQPTGTVSSLTIGGSNTFEFHVQFGVTNVLVTGGVRQEGRGGPTGFCVVYGTVLTAVQ